MEQNVAMLLLLHSSFNQQGGNSQQLSIEYSFINSFFTDIITIAKQRITFYIVVVLLEKTIPKQDGKVSFDNVCCKRYSLVQLDVCQ